MIVEVKGLSAYDADVLNSELNGVSFRQFQRSYTGDYTFNFADGLSSTRDIKTKNFTNFYLTDEYRLDNVIVFDSSKFKANKMVTPIKQGGTYLSFTPISATPYAMAGRYQEYVYYGIPTFEKEEKFLKIELNDNNICNISIENNGRRYYLVYDIDGKLVYVWESYLTFDSNINPQDFTYVFSQEADAIILLKPIDGGPNKILSKVKDQLSAVAYNGDIPTPFIVEKNLYQDPNLSLDTTFITYTPSNSTDASKTEKNQTNNFLLHNRYSNESPATDIIVLKNQLNQNDTFTSGNNLLSCTDPWNPYVNKTREYTSIAQNIKEEYSDDLELNYVFYNKDYKIDIGQTTFIAPSSMYPFTALNINDSRLIECGARSYVTPQYADKVYKLSDDSNQRNNGQHLLCTWLSGSPFSENKMWVDRYYYPDLISKADALASLQVFQPTYNDYIEGLVDSSFFKQNITDQRFFDTVSNLTFEPAMTYIYDRTDPEFEINQIDGCSPINYFKDINKEGEMTFGFNFNGDERVWRVESRRNDIDSGVTIRKDGKELDITFRMYDATGFTENFAPYGRRIKAKFKRLKENYFMMSVNVKKGKGYFFLNEELILTFDIPKYEFLLKKIIYGDFYLYRDNDVKNIFAANDLVKDIIITKAYTPPELAYIISASSRDTKTDTIYITLPCGMRNSSDNIEIVQNLCSYTGFRSNDVNILVKNLNISNQTVLDGLEASIRETVSKTLPANTRIKNVQFINFK